MLKVKVVAQNLRQRSRQILLHMDMSAEGIAARHPQHFRDGMVQVDWLQIDGALAQQFAHAMNRLAGSQVILADVFKDLTNLIDGDFLAVDQYQRCLGVAEHSRERLIDLVRNHGGQLAH